MQASDRAPHGFVSAHKPTVGNPHYLKPLTVAALEHQLWSIKSGLTAIAISLRERLSYGSLLFAGAMSAVVSRTAMAPLERVKMDMLLKTSASSNAMKTALQVFEKEGVAGFWKGNALNVLRTAPFKVSEAAPVQTAAAHTPASFGTFEIYVVGKSTPMHL